jgi:hypothetical protein
MTDIPAAIKALTKAQTQMGKALKNAANPHLKSKYADLGSVIDACFDALHANGFAVMQPCGSDDGGAYVETVFAHEGGHIFTSRIYLVLAKQDMQGLGSAITYARRYGLLGLAGLAPEDDDGEATKAPAPKRQERQPDPPKPAPEKPRDPRAIADALIDAAKSAVTLEQLNQRIGAQKFDDAWRWLSEAGHEPMSLEVKAAVNAARLRLEPVDHPFGDAA